VPEDGHDALRQLPLSRPGSLPRSLGTHSPGGLLSRLHRLLWITLLTFVASPAFAQYTRDNAANKKIDEAINTHYVATDFEKAEGVLLGTINACSDKCSPQTLGKAWMYVGIVRGSGKNNQAGAKDAFTKALAADPGVKLDTVLATPETQATFAALGGAAAAAPEPIAAAAPAAAPAAAGGGLNCTPDVRSVETRRQIPVQCSSDEEVTSMELKYKVFGSESWKTLPMQKKGESFRAQIPCNATENSGTLRVYVRAKDAQGETVDSWGSKTAPVEFNIAEGVTDAPPQFDDAEPPPRCEVKGGGSDCPPDFPGCGAAKAGAARGAKDWGEQCANSTECKSGLLCNDGTCQAAPSCESDADCTTGKCLDGKCDLPDDVGPDVSAFKKNWLGLNIAQDFAFVGGYNVCDPALGQKEDNYACFYEGTTDQPYFHTPYPPRDGINTGTVMATTRILVSFDRAFTSNITAGARLGFALGGGPPAGMSPAGNAKAPPAHATGVGGTPFLPLHIEVRGAFWFLPLTAKLLRAYVLVGGGMAQVDAKVKINEYDCEKAGHDPAGNDVSSPTLENGDTNPKFDDKSKYYVAPFPLGGQNLSPYQQCKRGKASNYNIKNAPPPDAVDGWRKMGQGFIEGGVGGMLAFKDNMGVTFEAKIMYMLPASGVVIQPSIGFGLGF